MAGTIVANTINTDTGLFSTNNAYSGIAKAWGNWVGSTGAINGSFNISSVTRNSTGDYTVNFTTAMPNANYVVVGGAISVAGTIPSVYVKTGVTPTTTACSLFAANTVGGTLYDYPLTFVAIFGA